MIADQGKSVIDLNSRSREIFKRIVDSYLATGEPVVYKIGPDGKLAGTVAV